MPILEDENRSLRNRICALETELRQMREQYARVMQENEQLKEHVHHLEASSQGGIEGRSDERIKTAFRIDVMNPKGFIAMGVARDVSPGGAFLETDLRLNLGESLTITFDLAGEPFKVKADVVRVTNTGFGVKFAMNTLQQERLRQTIERL